MNSKFNHELINRIAKGCFAPTLPLQDHLKSVNEKLSTSGHAEISLSTLMNTRKNLGLKSNRSHASQRTQRRSEVDLFNEAKSKALRLGIKIKPYKSVYQDNSNGIIIYYKIVGFQKEQKQSLVLLKGLAIKQNLQSIGHHRPDTRSLVAGTDSLFRKICRSFKPRLHFIKSKKVNQTHEIFYKVLEGIYDGYCGSRRWPDLLKSKAKRDDIRILSRKEGQEWIKKKALLECTHIRFEDEYAKFTCPIGHERSMLISNIVQWCKRSQTTSARYPCDQCNRGVFSGINLAESPTHRNEKVNFYITLSRVYNDNETSKYFGINAPKFAGGLCIKVGFYLRSIQERSRGPYRVDEETGKYILEEGTFFVRRVDRGLAFIAETLLLRKNRPRLLDKWLYAQQRKVDGYSEMIGFASFEDNYTAQREQCLIGINLMKTQYMRLENLLLKLSSTEHRYISKIIKCETWRRARLNEDTE